jgi:hypothetical protein
MILFIHHVGEAKKWENCWTDNSWINGTTLLDDPNHSSSRRSNKMGKLVAGQFLDYWDDLA